MSKAWLATVAELEAASPQNLRSAADAASPATLRAIEPYEEKSSEAQGPLPSRPQDWSTLVDQVQSAAVRMRSVEASAQEQDLRVQQILDKVRADIAEAEDRVRAADARLLDANERAAALLTAAEERIQEAEQRARIAEEWLARVEKTITSEFFLSVPGTP